MPGTVHDEFPNDTAIWRYMDLSRFVVLVAEKMVHFTKLTELHAGDPHEGYAQAKGLQRDLPEGKAEFPAEEFVPRFYAHLSHRAAREVREAAQHVYISSWCAGPESLGMWMLYGANGCGVAIRSTTGRFVNSLEKNLNVSQYKFGPVRYHPNLESPESASRDFTRGVVPTGAGLWSIVLKMGFNKRIAYAYEREWRAAIYQEERPDVQGIDVPVDVTQLIDAVFVGPKSSAVDVKAVEKALSAWNLAGIPTRSTLLTPPSAVSKP